MLARAPVCWRAPSSTCSSVTTRSSTSTAASLESAGGKIAEAFGVRAHELKVPWGKAVEPAAVEQALKDHPKAAAVYVQASESSTGVAHPVQAIAALTRDRDTLCVVDAVSALGAIPASNG